MSASFEQLLDENLSTVIMKQGSLVTGIVIDILDNHVVVHVGLKSEASMPLLSTRWWLKQSEQKESRFQLRTSLMILI